MTAAAPSLELLNLADRIDNAVSNLGHNSMGVTGTDELSEIADALRAALQADPAAVESIDPTLARFYQVSTVTELLAAQSEHIEKLQDSARRNVKPWEDTFPATLLPKYLRDSGLDTTPPPAALQADRAVGLWGWLIEGAPFKGQSCCDKTAIPLYTAAPAAVSDVDRVLRMALQHIRICAPDPAVDAALESALFNKPTDEAPPKPELQGWEWRLVRIGLAEGAALQARTDEAPPKGDDRYLELIYAVGNKYPGESRHETALRYIRQAEQQGDEHACTDATSQDSPT